MSAIVATFTAECNELVAGWDENGPQGRSATPAPHTTVTILISFGGAAAGGLDPVKKLLTNHMEAVKKYVQRLFTCHRCRPAMLAGR